MNLYELAKVAAYLNAATLKIKYRRRLAGGIPDPADPGGSLEWLTGTVTRIAFQATADSQETQCLSFGSTLWVANNDDGDTTTQKTFLDTLGINKAQQLIEHVAQFGHRPLEYHGGALVPGALTMKQDFLNRIAGAGRVAPGNAYVLRPVARNGEFNITSDEGSPVVSAIVFVRGTYRGNAHANLHAEQKLLAALSLLIRNGNAPTGEVAVGGIKTACGTCARVLADVRRRLNERNRNIQLQFENARADALRRAARLAADNNDNIRALDTAHYFP